MVDQSEDDVAPSTKEYINYSGKKFVKNIICYQQATILVPIINLNRQAVQIAMENGLIKNQSTLGSDLWLTGIAINYGIVKNFKKFS